MNAIFFALVAISFAVAGVRQLTWAPPDAAPGGAAVKAPMDALATAVINSAEASVTLAIGLVGVMGLWHRAELGDGRNRRRPLTTGRLPARDG